MTTLQSAGVDYRGLMKVLAENLYSTPEVALRELIQNAHDSIVRRQLEGGSFDARIHVHANPDGVLRIRDNGAGLTREEIVRYLATIGGGYTRVLRDRSDGLIGAFGLGFLSAYVVSDRVEVRTVSHGEPERGHLFRSADGLRFAIDEIEGGEPGTEVTLYLSQEHAQLGSPGRVRVLLERYCKMLPVPIFAPGVVNLTEHPWRTPAGARPAAVRQDVWISAAAAFETRFQVLAALPIDPIPGVDASGVVWIHDAASWATSDHRGVSVYVRGMMVTEDAHELLPEWAGFAGAAVETTQLTPTASREDLKRDETWTRVRAGLRSGLTSVLKTLFAEVPHAWRRIVERHNDALMGAALSEPELFDLLAEELELVTTEGSMCLPEIAQRSGHRLSLSVGDDSGYEQLLHRTLGRPVIDATRFGTAALATRWAAQKGYPVSTLGTVEGDGAFFTETVVDAATRAALEGLFDLEDTRLVFARFEPELVPLVLVPNRAAELKRRIEDDEADRRISAGLLGLARGFTATLRSDSPLTLYLNLGNPLVGRLAQAPPVKARAASAVLMAAADLTARRAADDFGRNLPEALEALTAAVGDLLD